MKWFLLLVIGGLAYFGYNYKDQLLDKYNAFMATRAAAAASATPGPSTSATPQPLFTSNIPIPETSPTEPAKHHVAPPGTFYMLERASVQTQIGVRAVNPGEQVKLLKRLKDGKMQVTMGNSIFEIKETQATNDLELAREAEKRDAMARGGKL